MELITLSCNSCGAPLEVPTNISFITCSYCKSRLAVHVSGSVAYTQILSSIDGKADRILENVEQIAAVLGQQTSPKEEWDFCKIELSRTLDSHMTCFAAVLQGDQGGRIVQRSGGFNGNVKVDRDTLGWIGRANRSVAEKELQKLKDKLAVEKWEPTDEGGEYWFSLTFWRGRSVEIWETCQIEVQAEGSTHWFRASGVGLHGTFVAGKSEAFTAQVHPSQSASVGQKKLDKLVKTLLNDGWQPYDPPGSSWYSLRFRRRL